jgi:uncharacterized protein (TIGR02996 family)
VSERAALLAAIAANPDDDTPRLVFADWLDEHEPAPGAGRKKSAAPSPWAALIRAECEFERLRADGSAAAAVFAHFVEYDERTLAGVRWERAFPEVGRRAELRRLIPGLRRASAGARAAGRARLRGGNLSADTHRGFCARVTVRNGFTAAQDLPAVMRGCPRVRFDFNDAQAADELAAALPRWCRSLAVRTDHADLLAALGRSPDAAGVREIRCRGTFGGDVPAVFRALAGAPHLSGLREFEFDSCYDYDLPESIKRLLRAPHLRGLTRLAIDSVGGAAEVVAALDALPHLRALELVRADVDDDAAVRLARAPGLANLRALHLMFNRITGRGASALLASPHLKNLAVLDLEGNPIRGLDRAALAGAPAGGLRLLGLQSCRLTGADAAAVAASPRAADLMFFAICRNPFPESTVARVIRALGARAPAVLYLMNANIKTAGARALADWPAAAQIDMLHLAENELSVLGARALAGCPHLRQLNHLCAGVGHATARSVLKTRFGARADV